MGGKAAIILVIGFGVIFGYLAMSLNEVESRAIDNASRYFEVTTSHNIAVAGANVALSKLYQDTSLWNMAASEMLLTKQELTLPPFSGGAFEARFLKVPMTDLRRVRAVSRLNAYGRTLRDTVEITLKRLTRYDILGLMMGFPGNDDTWISRDTMWGRIHFNGRVGIRGRPYFHDKVTVTKGFDPKHGVGTNHAIFHNGYETGVNEIPLPVENDAIRMTFPCADTTLTGPVSLQLVDTLVGNNNGFVVIRQGLHNYNTGVPRYYLYNLHIPAPKKGVLMINGDVSLKGIVDGRITIAATGKMYIDGDVRYTNNPEADPTSDDMLGLVAVGDIILWNDDLNPHTTQQEWTIQGVIVSLAGQIKAEKTPNNRYWIMRTYGGIIANKRFDIAQYGGAGGAGNPWPYLNGGFSRRFKWDSRLAASGNIPPCFPEPENLPGRLQIVNWWENVRIPEL